MMIAFLPVSGAEKALDGCFYQPFAQSMLWAPSGIWLERQGQKSLVLIDLIQSLVLGVQDSGQISEFGAENRSYSPRREISLARDGIDWRPSTISLDSMERVLVEDEGADVIHRFGDFLDLDASLESMASGGATHTAVLEVKKSAFSNDFAGSKLLGINDWVPLGKDQEGIVAIGDVELPSGSVEFRALRVLFKESGPGQAEPFPGWALPNKDPVRQLYLRRGFKHLAAIGDDIYMLLLDGEPRIGKLRSDSMEIELEFAALPEGFRERLHIDKKTMKLPGARRATTIYEKVENSALTIGLYAWDHKLYVLTKKQRVDQLTPWFLTGIDTQSGAELDTVRLPIEAPHVTVVPGDQWAFIERGPVRGLGDIHAPYMETGEMTLVPAGWMDGPRNDRLSRNSPTRCPLKGSQS